LKFFPKGSTSPEAYEGGRNLEDFVEFINNRVGLKGRVKKAPTSVVDLDASNFDKIVMDSSKDVLVEFYAPWCGHCKSLAPDYEKVAQAFAAESHVVVAKIDADKYKDIGGRYGVSGFPTIKFFSKTEKDTPLAYESPRDIPSFVGFLNQHAGTNRKPNGRLASTAGRIESLDNLAARFASEAGNRNSLLKQAEVIVSELDEADQKNGKIYVKTMQSIIGNAGYVESETARLNRMLEGSLAPKKVDEFTIRQNILDAFN